MGLFTKCLRESPSGSANEMLRICLDDCQVVLQLAAPDFARGTAPAETAWLVMLATMTALSKPDAGVTGTFFRRLAAKTLAKQCNREVEKTCSPFQFALSTRAGTDCVGHCSASSDRFGPTGHGVVCRYGWARTTMCCEVRCSASCTRWKVCEVSCLSCEQYMLNRRATN